VYKTKFSIRKKNKLNPILKKKQSNCQCHPKPHKKITKKTTKTEAKSQKNAQNASKSARYPSNEHSFCPKTAAGPENRPHEPRKPLCRPPPHSKRQRGSAETAKNRPQRSVFRKKEPRIPSPAGFFGRFSGFFVRFSTVFRRFFIVFFAFSRLFRRFF
jgi:hypothetical protein